MHNSWEDCIWIILILYIHRHAMECLWSVWWNWHFYNVYHAAMNMLQKSHNVHIPCPTMHPFVTEMCTCVHISVTTWCIVGCLSDALWDLWFGSIAIWCGTYFKLKKVTPHLAFTDKLLVVCCESFICKVQPFQRWIKGVFSDSCAIIMGSSRYVTDIAIVK